MLDSDNADPKVIAELVKTYEAAAEKLKAIVLDPFKSSFTRNDAANRLAKVASLIQELKHSAARWLGPAVTDAINEGKAAADKQAQDAGINLATAPPSLQIAGSFSIVNRPAVELIARATIGDLYKGADALQGTAFRALHRMADVGVSNADVNQIIAGGILKGDTRPMLQLRDDLKKIHGEKIIIPTKSGGTMTFDTDYYARLVADCKLKEAVRLGRHEQLMKRGIDLVIVYGHVSLNPCTLLLDKIFSLSGTSNKYPAWSSVAMGQLPYKFGHPHCSKRTRPFVEGLSVESAGRQEAAA